jgi:hypothetical protein
MAAARIGHVSDATMPTFLNNHSLYLDGDVIEKYGRLVFWDEDEEAFQKSISGLFPILEKL